MTINVGTQFDFVSLGSLGTDTDYVLDEYDMILVEDFAAVTHAVAGATFRINGTIAAGNGSTVLLNADGARMVVGDSGTVASATTQAVRALNQDVEVINFGIITGAQYGINSTNDGLVVENDGLISGGEVGIFFDTDASDFSILNDITGTIRGGDGSGSRGAIICEDDSSGTITNFGIIEGVDQFATGISLRGGGFDVANSGQIIGSSALSIIFDDASSITNEEDGIILGRTRAIQTNSLTDSSDMTITNHGIIESQQFVGVSMFSGGTLINTGTIIGFGGNKAVQGGGDDGGRFFLTNTGNLIGGVDASNRNDDIDTFNGTYTGSIELGGGRDRFDGSNLQSDTAFGQFGDDTMFGYAFNDFLDGGQGDDELFGGRGADTLIGGQDDDILNGGGGNDSLTGGSGFDTFVFGAASGEDTIEDWDSTFDTIDLSALGIRLFELNFAFTVDGADVIFDLDALGGSGELRVVGGTGDLFADDFIV